jgi:hypothetical protein
MRAKRHAADGRACHQPERKPTDRRMGTLAAVALLLLAPQGGGGLARLDAAFLSSPGVRSSCRARWCDMAPTTPTATTRVACPARPKRDYYCW